MKKSNKIRLIISNSIFILLYIAFSFVLHCGSAYAENSDNITFNWKANPSSENIVGYRLYYGMKSRFNENGSTKFNFQYDYCVDFTELLRCSGSNYYDCVDLGPAQLECQNISSANPKCTLKNMKGQKFFALTAYNYQSESSFTHELKLINTSSHSSTLISVYELLL